MALSLTLGAVSAEDAAAEDVVAADAAIDEVVAEEAPATGNAAGGEESVPVADIAVDVENLYEDDYGVVWGVAVANYGPDTAYDTGVLVQGSGNMYLLDYFSTDGEYLPDYGLWEVGDLEAGDVAYLFLETIKLGDGPFYVEALGVSLGSVDYFLANNYDIAWAGVAEESVSAAEETMPAAGNPIAMALLALIAIAGATFSRRF